MTNLIIDIGNTRIKCALFEREKLLQEEAFNEIESALAYWKSIAFDQCLVSSVRWSQDELQAILTFNFTYLSHVTSLPIHNAYGTPASLGLDRIAGAIGAWSMRGGGPILAIDLGTCITFDLIDGNNSYLGGAISPGLNMRAKAMHDLTARLPLVDLKVKPAELIGDNTITCMQIGIWRGIEFELRGQIEEYIKKFPEIEVFVTGGDAQSFDSMAKDLIFVVPNLVLYGLNSILNHNVE
ncbi:type III pantothenate kinase [Algoriphagus ratkowskyi]|uniref:Type III pantothenate kinase n=1 Tax=Algoriphagus ratkowskyi TaxID=57028 RepID=A0A2W7RXG6_9BACT|nr:type III pantothenate kinase [Algoriphagus ratkowskyi]PZX59897.1 type III pantothenate kinase [Algoriphagus ratkowskyi]TXD78400.1 type III pantothenate kinase [Algoriphagus ratkowskyi]